MKKKQAKFLIGGVVVIASISYLIYAGIKETSVYYLTVSEATAMTDTREDLRIEGNVVPGSIQKASDALGADFKITDSKNSIAIKYHGTIPDMFAEDIDVVVQGKFDPVSGVFNAHTLLTSCPSKYEASKREGQKA